MPTEALKDVFKEILEKVQLKEEVKKIKLKDVLEEVLEENQLEEVLTEVLKSAPNEVQFEKMAMRESKKRTPVECRQSPAHFI